MKSIKYKFDVVIIGGGPAGTASAIKLSQSGVSVVILERTDYKSIRIGETLPPEANLELYSLGVCEEFLNAGHLPSPGNISAWGSNKLSEIDFLFSPFGCGWHINRSKFDLMLLTAAENNGAKVFKQIEVTDYFQLPDNKWQVIAYNQREILQFEATYLLFATGRRAKMKLPFEQKIVFDHLIGTIKILNLKILEKDFDCRTLVEADQNGWWYSALLPKNQLVLAYMTDTDLLPKKIKNTKSIWDYLLSTVFHTRSRVKDCNWNDETFLFPANTYYNLQPAGQKWMAIGDLAFAVDPLSSQGILNALKSGMNSAEVVLECLQGKETLLEEILFHSHEYFNNYLIKRRQYYQLEKRWPNSIFWQRRNSSCFAEDVNMQIGNFGFEPSGLLFNE